DPLGEGNVIGDTLVLEPVEQREFAAAIARVQSPPQGSLAALDQMAERALLPVGLGVLVAARKLLLRDTAPAVPERADAVVRRIEKIRAHSRADDRDAGCIQLLANAGENAHRVGPGQRTADDPLADARPECAVDPVTRHRRTS